MQRQSTAGAGHGAANEGGPGRNPPGMPQLRGPSKWYCKAVAQSATFQSECDTERKKRELMARRKAAAEAYTLRGKVKRHPPAGDRAGAALRDADRAASIQRATPSVAGDRGASPARTAATPSPAPAGLDEYRAFASESATPGAASARDGPPPPPEPLDGDAAAPDHMSDLELESGDHSPCAPTQSTSESLPAAHESSEASPAPPPLRMGTVPPNEMRRILSDDRTTRMNENSADRSPELPATPVPDSLADDAEDDVQISPESNRGVGVAPHAGPRLSTTNPFREARLAELRRQEKAKSAAESAEAARRAAVVTRIVTTLDPEARRSGSARNASASPNVVDVILRDQVVHADPTAPLPDGAPVPANDSAKVIEAIMNSAATHAARSRQSIGGPSTPGASGHNTPQRSRSRSPSLAMRVSHAGSTVDQIRAAPSTSRPRVSGTQVSLASNSSSKGSFRPPGVSVAVGPQLRRAPAAVPLQWSAAVVEHDEKATGSIAAASQRQSPEAQHHHAVGAHHHHHHSLASSRSVSEALHDPETHAATFHRPHLLPMLPTSHLGTAHGETHGMSHRVQAKPPHSLVDGEGGLMSSVPTSQFGTAHGETQGMSHRVQAKPPHSRVDGEGELMSPVSTVTTMNYDDDAAEPKAGTAPQSAHASPEKAEGSPRRSSTPASPSMSMSWEMTW